LANDTLEQQIINITLPSINNADVNTVEEKESWMAPIIQFLKFNALSSDKAEAKNLKYKSARYIMQGDSLYKRGFSTPLMKCVDADDAQYVMKEIHGGICGNWPTMKADIETRYGYYGLLGSSSKNTWRNLWKLAYYGSSSINIETRYLLAYYES